MARPPWLLAALGATVGLSAWLALQPDDTPVSATAQAVPARPRPNAVLPAASALTVPPAPAARSAWPDAPPHVLAAWSGPPPPPPPPPAAPAAPPRPPVPPFPYRWIGSLDDGAGTQALLSGPQRSFGARAGDVLDAQWRVDRITVAGLQLTWLPTGDAVNVDAR